MSTVLSRSKPEWLREVQLAFDEVWTILSGNNGSIQGRERELLRLEIASRILALADNDDVSIADVKSKVLASFQIAQRPISAQPRQAGKTDWFGNTRRSGTAN